MSSNAGGDSEERTPRVVVVDDDPLVLAVTRRLLTRSGYHVISCDHPRTALREVIQGEPFAVVADLHMPDLDGAELLRLVRSFSPNTRRILYTGESHLSEIARAVSPVVVDAIVTKADGNPQLPLALSGLRAEQRGRQGSNEARSLALSLVSALAVDHVETLEHALRLSRGALKLGSLAGLEVPALRDLEVGALLHDVGMFCIPETLLRHPTPYCEREWRQVQQHPLLGAEFLRSSELLAGGLSVVLYHHEHYDGSGYPHRLSGSDIPLLARLFSVIDTFEALTHERPHRPARSETQAREEIARVSGSQLDPTAVELFLGIHPDDWKRPSFVPSAMAEP
ncbi:MAG: HD domain-containing phosphohydrolase [Myxococcales bacterium]